jgi:WD40 repeat protein
MTSRRGLRAICFALSVVAVIAAGGAGCSPRLAVTVSLTTTLAGHGDQIMAIAFAPDRNVLMAASRDNQGSATVRTWDPATGKIVGTALLLSNRGEVRSAAFSRDGRTVAAGFFDETIHRWDLVTGQAIEPPLAGQHPLGSTAAVLALAINGDASRLATGGNDTTVRLWNLTTGQPIGPYLPQGHTASVLAVAFSPDGSRLASGGADHDVRLWETGTRRLLGQLVGHTYTVNSVAFSPDGRTLASGGGDRQLMLWKANNGDRLGKPLAHKGFMGTISGIAFSPDGRIVADGGSDPLRLWDVKAGRQLTEPFPDSTYSAAQRSTQLSSYTVTAMAFSPDGRTLATGCLDGTIRLWTVREAR